MKVITPGKIGTSTAFIARTLVRGRISTQTFFSANAVTHFQVLSVTFIEYGQNVKKTFLMDKAILGKMGGVYVTYAVDVDKGQ